MAKKLLILKFGLCEKRSKQPLPERGMSNLMPDYMGVVNVTKYHSSDLAVPDVGMTVDEAVSEATRVDWELIQVTENPHTGEVRRMYFKHD